MFEVRNDAESAEILLYDFIGEDIDWLTGEKSGISAQTFKEALDSVSPKPVTLRINSGGGDVFEAFAMCSAIQRYKGKTTAYIEGLAASAASYIAAVCDDVVMCDYSFLMIHCAFSWCCGNARDLRDTAARLENIDNRLASIYEKRSNLSLDEVLDYMADETWFTADKALEVGLITEVVETEERVAACIDPKIAKAYRHVPDGIVRDSNTDAETPAGHVGPVETEPAMDVEKTEDAAESYAEPTLNEETAAIGAASYVLLGGKLYRKDQA